MQIVIDVDENVFTRLFDNGTEDYEIMDDDLFAIAKSIRNGTPLPKGHGRLIDADALPQEDKDIAVKSILKPGTIACVGAITLQEYINSLPTIIEAESEE